MCQCTMEVDQHIHFVIEEFHLFSLLHVSFDNKTTKSRQSCQGRRIRNGSIHWIWTNLNKKKMFDDQGQRWTRIEIISFLLRYSMKKRRKISKRFDRFRLWSGWKVSRSLRSSPIFQMNFFKSFFHRWKWWSRLCEDWICSNLVSSSSFIGKSIFDWNRSKWIRSSFVSSRRFLTKFNSFDPTRFNNDFKRFDTFCWNKVRFFLFFSIFRDFRLLMINLHNDLKDVKDQYSPELSIQWRNISFICPRFVDCSLLLLNRSFSQFDSKSSTCCDGSIRIFNIENQQLIKEMKHFFPKSNDIEYLDQNNEKLDLVFSHSQSLMKTDWDSIDQVQHKICFVFISIEIDFSRACRTLFIVCYRKGHLSIVQRWILDSIIVFLLFQLIHTKILTNI